MAAAAVLLALACSVAGGGQSATTEALAESIAATATARAAGGSLGSSARQTAEAAANALDESTAATQAAEAALRLELDAATATAVAPMLMELPLYGVDPTQGRPGWVHPPETLDVQGFMQYDFANRFIATVAQDLAVAADITWDTTTGLSGCGFVLRSDGNKEALNQYMVIATRGANGHVVFAPQVNGEVETGVDLYARGIDPLFQSANGTTNRLVVVARGSTFDIYTNGTWIGQISDTRFDRGFVALVALSESGRTVCQFSNAWMWLIS